MPADAELRADDEYAGILAGAGVSHTRHMDQVRAGGLIAGVEQLLIELGEFRSRFVRRGARFDLLVGQQLVGIIA